MKPAFRLTPLLALLAAALLLATTGCVSTGTGRGTGQATVVPKATTLPARLALNLFLVEAKQDDGRVRRFLIDTGSSTTLVTPELAGAIRLKEKAPGRTVRITGAQGGHAELPAATLRRLVLGDASFERVPALIYDLADLSSRLGVQVDGVVGFPVFRDTLLTLDYPAAKLVIAPIPVFAPAAPRPAPRSSTLAFNPEQSTPLIPLQMGNESFIALIDTGSDGALSLNPAGLHPRFLNGPRAGHLVASLGGDQPQMVGRLAQNLLIGGHTVRQPVAGLTDQLSSIGGELLRNFSLTFDQRRNLVTFARPADGEIDMPARRSTGLSFGRSANYWRILNIVPDTPTAQLPVRTGDLCTRINGEPVTKWDAERYAALLRTAAKITYTLLAGPKETDIEIPVIELVP